MAKFTLEGYEDLLSKRRLTGEELGRLEVANLLTGLKGPDPRPIPDEYIIKMANQFNSKTDIQTYNEYMELYSWTTKYFNIAISQEYKAQLHASRLLNRVSQFSIKETMNIFLSELPVVMTEDQYNRLVSENTSAEVQGNSNVYSNLVGSKNGVCILKYIGTDTPINENGDYIPPAPQDVGVKTADLEEYTMEKYKVDVLNDLLFLQESVYFLHGYNELLQMMADKYRIPEFLYVKRNAECADANIDVYNKGLEYLKEVISNHEYMDPDKKELRLKALSETFPILNKGSMRISKYKIEEAREMVAGVTTFSTGLQEIAAVLLQKGDLQINEEYT